MSDRYHLERIRDEQQDQQTDQKPLTVSELLRERRGVRGASGIEGDKLPDRGGRQWRRVRPGRWW